MVVTVGQEDLFVDCIQAKTSSPKVYKARETMAHVITDTCTKDELCLETCPNGSIAPSHDDANFETATQLYINPEECIDCGACVPVCPTNSIYPGDELPADKAEFAEKNAEYFQK